MPDHSSTSRPAARATSPSMEQYIETIAYLLTQGSVCSVSDIAAHACVSRPAASRAVRDLAAKSLVQHKSYGYVELTEQGRALARRLEARHAMLFDFLQRVLGLSEDDANREACRLEHHLDDELVKRMGELTSFLEADETRSRQWQQRLEQLTKPSM
ncbi:MAG: metal-dependent transcriptional regulator [Candidatus Hydrogenedentes bacterium]|nr:metal-dependent transcriptional regulator [Candidatus Hydrogenedentota bacterium]